MYKKTFTITVVSLALILALFSSFIAHAQTYGPCETILEEASVGVVADDDRTDTETFSLAVGRTVNIQYAFDYANGAKGVSRVCLYHSDGTLTSFGCKPGSEGWYNATLFLPAGSYWIEAYANSVNPTGDGGGGIMISAVISLTADKVTPTLYSVTGGGVACDGGNVSIPIGLNGSDGGFTYQLLRNNVPVATYTAPASGGAFSFGNFTTPGTYTVNTIAPCVVATMNGSAVITDPRPINFIASNDGPKCATTPAPSVTLSATNIAGATYYWTGPYGALQTTNTNSAIVSGLAGTFTYTVYAVINGCTTPTAPTQVTLYPIPPPATAGADQNVCSLAAILHGNPAGAGFSGQWTQISGPGNFQSQIQDPTAFDSPVSTTVPGTYVYQWSISGAPVCGVSADQVSVTFNIMPATGTVTVSSTSPRCSNDPPIIISLAGSQTGINYQLKINGANSGAPQGGTGGTLTWPDQGSGNYTVQAIGTGGCTQMMSGEHAITVNPAPTLYTVGGGGAVCTGSPFAITLSGSQVGVNYVLKRGTTTLTTLAGTGDNLSWGNQVLPGTYTVTASNASCTRLMGTVTVTLNASPSPFSVSGGGERCDDQPGLTVSLNGSQGGNIVTYQLKRDNVNVGAPVAGTGSALNWEGLTEAGTYTILAIHSNGCTRIMNSSSPVVIATKAAPTPANAGADINACGTQTILHANTPAVGTGAWSQISGPIASHIETPNLPNTAVSTTQPNTYVYAWTITNNNGCVSTDNVQVIYNAVATVANAGPDQTVCDDVFAVMAANTPLVGNGEWILVSGPQGAVFFPDAYTPDAILFVADPGTYVYRWTITNQPCPASTDDVQITFSTGCSARSGGNQRSAATAESSELRADAVHVYPVPASQSVTVQTPFGGTWKAELRNMNGTLLRTITSNEKTSTLEVSDIPAGLYVLYIQSDRNRLIKKVEVVR